MNGRGVVSRGLELVATRSLVDETIVARFPLSPGDRVLVSAGERVDPGQPLAERLRDARFEEVQEQGADARPGARWSGELPRTGLRRRAAEVSGELLFVSGGRWRLAVGEHVETLEAPVAGIVRAVHPGVGIVLDVSGRGLPGVAALGDPARGVLALAHGVDQDPRTTVDAGSAGRILVASGRADAQTLTKARAMGVRGIIVTGLAGKERRDFLASEARQRAALQPLPTFAVLVLDGAVRRELASPVRALLESLAGHEVGIVPDPPRLVFDVPSVGIPEPEAGYVRARSGPLAGQEGHWEGLAGMRRFAAGIHLESGWVRFGSDDPVAVPLGDLERYTA